MDNVSTLHTFDLFDLKAPETINLSNEAIHDAQTLSSSLTDESERWQAYLNRLGHLAFAEWHRQHGNVPNPGFEKDKPPSQSSFDSTDALFYKMGQLTCCILTVEQMLDERIAIPQFTLSHPSTAPHIYVVIEVIEEENLAILRGFSRLDIILKSLSLGSSPASKSDVHWVPLSNFNPDLTHLLFYDRFVNPANLVDLSLFPQAMEHPTDVSPQKTPVIRSWNSVRTNLSQWLQGQIEDGWSMIDDLIDLNSSLAFSTRAQAETVPRGKLLNLGLRLKDRTVALIINVTPEPEDKLKVLVQLHPTMGQRYLSSDLKLILRSKSGTLLQEVQARSHDNYIQLKPFIGETEKCFCVEVCYADGIFREDFKL